MFVVGVAINTDVVLDGVDNALSSCKDLFVKCSVLLSIEGFVSMFIVIVA